MADRFRLKNSVVQPLAWRGGRWLGAKDSARSTGNLVNTIGGEVHGQLVNNLEKLSHTTWSAERQQDHLERTFSLESSGRVRRTRGFVVSPFGSGWVGTLLRLYTLLCN